MTMNKRWLVFVFGALAGAAVAVTATLFIARRSKPSETAESHQPGKALFQCPMHPSVVSDKPGNCPICGMKLQKVEDGTPSGGKGRVLYYRNPMNPEITSKTPAKDSMGMDYIPVYKNEQAPPSGVSDHAVVKLPKWREQLIGITTTKASYRALKSSIRTVGKIAYDPDLYTAMTEYREALISRDKVKDSPYPDVHEQADSLVRASALKLKLMGLGEEQIAAIGQQGAPTNLLMGKAGGMLWVYAEIYEQDVALVSAGQSVSVTLPAVPGRTFTGIIKAVDPVLNPNTRTVRVRAEIPDPKGVLKPEMFANVSIEVPLGDRLAVPIDAVLDTGTRQLVFVEVAEGEFDPREVKVGRQADGFYEVLSGVKAGEAVVTRANFLLDSESKLRATGEKASQEAMPGMPGMKESKP